MCWPFEFLSSQPQDAPKFKLFYNLFLISFRFFIFTMTTRFNISGKAAVLFDTIWQIFELDAALYQVYVSYTPSCTVAVLC